MISHWFSEQKYFFGFSLIFRTKFSFDFFRSKMLSGKSMKISKIFDKIKKKCQAFGPIKALDHASNLCRALSFSISCLVSVTCYRTGFYRFSSDFGKWIESNQEARRSLVSAPREVIKAKFTFCNDF